MHACITVWPHVGLTHQRVATRYTRCRESHGIPAFRRVDPASLLNPMAPQCHPLSSEAALSATATVRSLLHLGQVLHLCELFSGHNSTSHSPLSFSVHTSLCLACHPVPCPNAACMELQGVATRSTFLLIRSRLCHVPDSDPCGSRRPALSIK
jgi:hypothetical protein